MNQELAGEWRKDPGKPSQLRWWDGRKWTDYTRPPGKPGEELEPPKIDTRPRPDAGGSLAPPEW